MISYGGVTLDENVTECATAANREDRFWIPPGGKPWIARQRENQENEPMTDHDKLREGIKLVRRFAEAQVAQLPPSVAERDLLLRAADAAELSAASALPHPASLDDKALFAMWDGHLDGQLTKCGSMRAAYQALYDHLTKPTYSWHVRSGAIFFVCDTEEAALAQVMEQIRNGHSAVISRTGEPT